MPFPLRFPSLFIYLSIYVYVSILLSSNIRTCKREVPVQQQDFASSPSQLVWSLCPGQYSQPCHSQWASTQGLVSPGGTVQLSQSMKPAGPGSPALRCFQVSISGRAEPPVTRTGLTAQADLAGQVTVKRTEAQPVFTIVSSCCPMPDLYILPSYLNPEEKYLRLKQDFWEIYIKIENISLHLINENATKCFPFEKIE